MNKHETFSTASNVPTYPNSLIYSIDCLREIVYQYKEQETPLLVTVGTQGSCVDISTVVAQVTNMYINVNQTLMVEIKRLNTDIASTIYHIDRDCIRLSLACLGTIDIDHNVQPTKLKIISVQMWVL